MYPKWEGWIWHHWCWFILKTATSRPALKRLTDCLKKRQNPGRVYLKTTTWMPSLRRLTPKTGFLFAGFYQNSIGNVVPFSVVNHGRRFEIQNSKSTLILLSLFWILKFSLLRLPIHIKHDSHSPHQASSLLLNNISPPLF